MAGLQQEFRKACGRFATGVTVITVRGEGESVHGMTANAFCSVSLEPLLVLVCVDLRARSHPLIRAQRQFGINVLAADQRDLSNYYARPDRDHESDHGTKVRFHFTQRGTPLLEGCLAQMDCRLVAEHEAGDHTIFVAEVEEISCREGVPLLFYAGQYRAIEEERRKVKA